MTLEQELMDLIKAKHRRDGTYKPRLKRLEERLTKVWKDELRGAQS